MGSDPRIGPHFLQPGPGYGGSCFPKDVKAILHLAKGLNLPLEVIAATDKANAAAQTRPFRELQQIYSTRQETLTNKRIGIWGVAFKAGTDDLRDSSAVSLILMQAGAVVAVHDPQGLEACQRIFGESVVIPMILWQLLIAMLLSL